MSTAKNAIIKALVEGIITELMVKTSGEQVYLDDTTTVAAKISEMVTAINQRAKSSDVTVEINQAVNAAVTSLINGAPEAYNTLKELADYISAHGDVVEALQTSVGNKADKSTVDALQTIVNGLGSLSKLNTVSENNLDTALQEKVNAAAQGNHSHSNKAVLDGITAGKMSAWDNKGNIYYASTQPGTLTANDLWVQLV